MKKNKFITGAVVVFNILNLISCTNPAGSSINNYSPSDLKGVKVDISKSDIVADYIADSTLNQLGTFTDNFEYTYLIKTKIDKKSVQGYKGNPGDPFSNSTDFNDLLLKYPISIDDDTTSHTANSTSYYAKFDTNNKILEVRQGAFGDGPIRKYCYMVLPDTLEKNNGFDVYIAKENGQEAIAMISNIETNNDNLIFYYQTCSYAPKTPAKAKKFMQIKSEDVYSDLEKYNEFLKENPKAIEIQKYDLELCKKYPEYKNGDKIAAFYNRDFPNKFTQNVWQNKKEISQNFEAKKAAISNIFNSLFTRTSFINQDYKGAFLLNGSEIPVIYTTCKTEGQNSNILSIEDYTLLKENYFNFCPITTYEAQFFTDNWYYEYDNGKITAYLTDKGYDSKSASSLFIEGDSVTLKLISSNCETEKLPGAIIFSAKIATLKDTIIGEIPEVTLYRDNYTATELNTIFTSTKKWNIEATEAKNAVPTGIIEYTNHYQNDTLPTTSSNSYLYVTSTSKLNSDWVYVNKTDCPIIFKDSSDINKHPLVEVERINLGVPYDYTVEGLPSENGENSMINLNGYSASSVEYNTSKKSIILTGSTTQTDYPETITLTPTNNI